MCTYMRTLTCAHTYVYVNMCVCVYRRIADTCLQCMVNNTQSSMLPFDLCTCMCAPKENPMHVRRHTYMQKYSHSAQTYNNNNCSLLCLLWREETHWRQRWAEQTPTLTSKRWTIHLNTCTYLCATRLRLRQTKDARCLKELRVYIRVYMSKDLYLAQQGWSVDMDIFLHQILTQTSNMKNHPNNMHDVHFCAFIYILFVSKVLHSPIYARIHKHTYARI
jgi:hypothetical protein